MGFRYQQPDNEDSFEQMSLRFYRKVWKNESLQLYAKRGEKQDGVDIHDPACLKPVRAVQCKHHELTKTLTPTEIKNEVAKAEKSTLPIEHYVIATTAKKSKNAQDTVVNLNNRPERKFTVELHFWEEICEELSQLPPVQAYFIVSGRDTAADILASILQDPQIAAVASRLLSVAPAEPPAGAYSEIEQLLNNRSFEAAEHELTKLPVDDELALLPNDKQYKILRLRAKLALETGKFEQASQQFLAAYDLQPDLDQAKQNRVLAYSLIRDAEKAFELACHYVSAGLTTPVMLCRLIENAPSVDQINKHEALITPHLWATHLLPLQTIVLQLIQRMNRRRMRLMRCHSCYTSRSLPVRGNYCHISTRTLPRANSSRRSPSSITRTMMKNVAGICSN